MLLWTLLPAVALAVLFAEEMTASRGQARLLSRLAQGIGFRVESGPSPATVRPGSGPYDERLGYARLPDFVKRLEAAGYRIDLQARPTERLQRLRAWGLYPTYREKSQAGIEILDREDRLLYKAQFPARVYRRFEDIPHAVVAALLFIENRDMLDPRYPSQNPALDWGRLAKAVGVKALSLVDRDRKVIGGSTLATQLEKFRHSPEGRTRSARDKLRQMISASLRAYQEGEDTLPARRRVVVDYINSVPLAAAAGFGEVCGLGDGLWAWYGRDLDEVSRLLSSSSDDGDRALAFKEVLSLFLAQRRPAFYLGEDRRPLEALTNAYLRLLAAEGVISPVLRDLAVGSELSFRSRTAHSSASFADRKAANLLRARLLGELGLSSLYDLDRLDLAVKGTLDGAAQEAVSQRLQAFRDPTRVREAGLGGDRLLEQGDPSRVVYALTLYERGAGANLLRVQTDSLDRPLDVNDGARLDLGSTAKLRTLVTYLEIVAALHDRYAALPLPALRSLSPDRKDRLSVWAVGYLAAAQDRSLAPMLDAALDRTYSASPSEAFFTGGGLHRFGNFSRDDDGRILSVREGFRRSVNLVFIRLMRDIENYYLFQRPGSAARLLQDPDDPRRRTYLARFADQEGSEFLRRFYRKHQGKTIAESLDLVVSGTRPSAERLATILGSVDPGGGADALKSLIARHLPQKGLSDAELVELLGRYSATSFSLMDRGYIAGVHPLELWLVDYLRRNPSATLAQALADSAAERQEVYGWLFRTSRKHAQDRRIASLLEIEAFLEIHAAWQRLGYPFASLTPSLAAAIGSSGDRPAALAELMGIIANGGVRFPTARVERLRFAADTPYETVLTPEKRGGERVLAPEVAAAVRGLLVDVVEKGTAQRLQKALVRADGSKRVVGGKTGTGDERYERYGPGGRLLESRVVSRAAVFVFLIDDTFFGTLTAYVLGPEAARYRFTSSLPVQILGVLLPDLSPVIDRPRLTAVPAKEEPSSIPAAQGRLSRN